MLKDGVSHQHKGHISRIGRPAERHAFRPHFGISTREQRSRRHHSHPLHHQLRHGSCSAALVCPLLFRARLRTGRLARLVSPGQLIDENRLKFRFGAESNRSVQATLISFTVLSIILINLGSGRHFAYIQYVLDNAIVSRTEALDFWAHLVYTTCLLICRLSGLAFFSRIADRQRQLTWSIRVTAGVMIALWLPQMALIIFHCIPVTAYWPYAFEANAEKYKCLQWGIVYVTNSAISLLCDLALFTIPALIIAQLKISKKDKLKLACIMMPGLLVIAISCTRMYLVIVGQWQVSFFQQYCSSSAETDMFILYHRRISRGATTACSPSKWPKSAPLSSPCRCQHSSHSSERYSHSSTAPLSHMLLQEQQPAPHPEGRACFVCPISGRKILK